MSNKKSVVINVGSISVLVIFVLLCLTTFATLSMVSANADLKLTKSAAEALSSYYKADSEAEDILASIDSSIKNSATKKNKQDYFNSIKASKSMPQNVKFSDDGIIEYAVKVNDSSELKVTVEVTYPVNDNKRYTLKKWQTVNISDEISDDSLNLWKSNS